MEKDKGVSVTLTVPRTGESVTLESGAAVDRIRRAVQNMRVEMSASEAQVARLGVAEARAKRKGATVRQRECSSELAVVSAPEVPGGTRILKVKFREGKPVTVVWEVSGENGWNEFSMRCEEQPSVRFTEALQALEPMVAVVCDLPQFYTADMTVTGVSFAYQDDAWGACVTAMKSMKEAFGGTLVLNTPYVVAEGPVTREALPQWAVNRLLALAGEAWAYVGGERAQMQLPLPLDGEEDAGEMTD